MPRKVKAVKKIKKCAYVDCSKHARACSLCVGHYRQYKLGEELKPLRGPHGKVGESKMVGTRLDMETVRGLERRAKKDGSSTYAVLADAAHAYVIRK